MKDRFRILGRDVRVGTMAVGLTGLAVVACTVAMAFTADDRGLLVLRNIALMGFIGGFTNTLAIRMLFEEIPFVPGSGILLREKDRIIASLADTMEEHILNPALVEARVREITGDIDRERMARAINGLLDELRPVLVAMVDTPEHRVLVRASLEQEGGALGQLADRLGIVTYQDLSDRLLAAIAEQVEAFTIDEDMVDAVLGQVGSVDEFLLQPGNPLVRKHLGSESSLAQIVFERLDARQLVIDRLSSYEATEIRDIIAHHVREHMTWLELFGVLLGMALALLAALLDPLLR